jgi:hypothetical protein
MPFGSSKVVIYFLVQNWQEISQQLTSIFDDFLGFVHSMAKKSMKKCLSLQMRTKTD